MNAGSYSLFGGESPRVDTNFEEFFTLRIQTQPAKTIRSLDKIPTLEKCVLCGEGYLNVYKIERSCKCSQHPCEFHHCKCSTEVILNINSSNASSDFGLSNSNTEGVENKTLQVYPACANCISMHLWKSTNENLKTNGRYRAKCPFCKAEFCHLDLVLLQSAPTQISSKPKKSNTNTNTNTNTNSNSNLNSNSKSSSSQQKSKKKQHKGKKTS